MESSDCLCPSLPSSEAHPSMSASVPAGHARCISQAAGPTSKIEDGHVSFRSDPAAPSSIFTCLEWKFACSANLYTQSLTVSSNRLSREKRSPFKCLKLSQKEPGRSSLPDSWASIVTPFGMNDAAAFSESSCSISVRRACHQ